MEHKSERATKEIANGLASWAHVRPSQGRFFIEAADRLMQQQTELEEAMRAIAEKDTKIVQLGNSLQVLEDQIGHLRMENAMLSSALPSKSVARRITEMELGV